jgi:hypothetical protein
MNRKDRDSLWWNLRKGTTSLHVQWGRAHGTVFATDFRMREGPPVTIALSLDKNFRTRSKGRRHVRGRSGPRKRRDSGPQADPDPRPAYRRATPTLSAGHRGPSDAVASSAGAMRSRVHVLRGSGVPSGLGKQASRASPARRGRREMIAAIYARKSTDSGRDTEPGSPDDRLATDRAALAGPGRPDRDLFVERRVPFERLLHEGGGYHGRLIPAWPSNLAEHGPRCVLHGPPGRGVEGEHLGRPWRAARRLARC